MQFAHRIDAASGTALTATTPLVLAALALVLSGPAGAGAQQDEPAAQPTAQTPADPEAGDGQSADDPLTFLDSVTVSATLRPAPVRETPGMVSVIDSQTIQGTAHRELRRPRQIRTGCLRREQRDPSRAQWLQHPRYRREPGDDPGGRRADVGAIRLRAVQRPPGGTRRRRAEVCRDRAERELGAVRERCSRRRRVALYQGPRRLPA